MDVTSLRCTGHSSIAMVTDSERRDSAYLLLVDFGPSL